MKTSGTTPDPHRILLLLAMLIFGAACGGPEAAASLEAAPAFEFVRDEADVLPAGQRSAADRQLRDIAERTGVYGVLVTVGEGQEVDPPRIYTPIVAEVTALGGEALIAICSPTACGPAAGGPAHTQGLNDAVARVQGSEPVPPGHGGANVNRGLRDWVAFVALVAAVADR